MAVKSKVGTGATTHRAGPCVARAGKLGRRQSQPWTQPHSLPSLALAGLGFQPFGGSPGAWAGLKPRPPRSLAQCKSCCRTTKNAFGPLSASVEPNRAGPGAGVAPGAGAAGPVAAPQRQGLRRLAGHGGEAERGLAQRSHQGPVVGQRGRQQPCPRLSNWGATAKPP